MEMTGITIVSGSTVFKGAESSPFLAPRGIWINDTLLLVSDTGQNRVFLWPSLPGKPMEEPTVVLGQKEIPGTHRNAGQTVNAGSLQYPSGIWANHEYLVVADAWNHRVLIWHGIPTVHGQPADVVIGQPGFEHNLPNCYGIGAEPSPQTLNWPYGVHSDGDQLWIADTGNRRVLYYRTMPVENFTPADAVIGQEDFHHKEYDSQNAIWPYTVRVDAAGRMAITDTQYYRVLLWDDWEKALHHPADAIIGQPGFSDNGQNQYGLQPSAHTLNWCYDSFFDDEGIWVADTGNSRLLGFRQVPSVHNAPADQVIGQADFDTGSENIHTVNGTEKTLYWPFSLCVHQGRMAIADTGNHRVILTSNYT